MKSVSGLRSAAASSSAPGISAPVGLQGLQSQTAAPRAPSASASEKMFRVRAP